MAKIKQFLVVVSLVVKIKQFLMVISLMVKMKQFLVVIHPKVTAVTNNTRPIAFKKTPPKLRFGGRQS